MKLILATLLLFVLGSFANVALADSDIVQLSPDTYMITKTSYAGVFGSMGSLKAEVIREANQFAEGRGKVAIPIYAQPTPAGPGRFASFEYQFRVVDKSDPEARRTALVPRADITIERTDKIQADIRTKDMTPKDAAPKTSDLYSELTKLDDLRKKGILTEAEFEAQKKRLLERN